MKKAHPVLADFIQSVFCLTMSLLSYYSYTTDQSHQWTRYWYLAFWLMWGNFAYTAILRLWTRFREGPPTPKRPVNDRGYRGPTSFEEAS